MILPWPFVWFYITAYISIAGYLLFYPTHNDIAGIVGIMNETNRPWLNGFYGPGFNILNWIIGSRLQAWVLFSLILFLASVFLFSAALRATTKKSYPTMDSAMQAALAAGLVFLYTVIELNPIELLTSAFILLSASIWLAAQAPISKVLLSAVALSAATMLREHVAGLIIVLLLCWYIFLKKNEKTGIKEFASIMLFSILINIVFRFYLPDDSNTSWQKFNVYRHINQINWYEISSLSGSPDYRYFNILKLIFNSTSDQLAQILVLVASCATSLLPAFTLALCTKTLNGVAKSTIMFAILSSFVLWPGYERGIAAFYTILLGFLFPMFLEVVGGAKALRLFTIALLLLSGSELIKIPFKIRDYRQSFTEMEAINNELVALGVNNEFIYTDVTTLHLRSMKNLTAGNYGWAAFHPDIENIPVTLFVEKVKEARGAIITLEGSSIDKNLPSELYDSKISKGDYSIFLIEKEEL